ncbi:MAG: hypothetical protein HY055_09090 [Magnetospirillum sp.]|nr:hypothetical protein [Magnetospirillum sp.]
MPSRRPPSPDPAPAESATQCCQSVGATMIGHFATRLEVEANKAGGSLNVAQIRALAQHFVEAEQSRFKAYYRRAWDECSQSRETLQWESARSKPFDRILMRRFAHLFPPRTGDDGGAGILSRRMIPGFHMAIDKMIGPTLYQQCQTQCEIILARHALPGGGWNWSAVHADADASALINDILVVIARTFAAFDKRRAWFLEMVNSHLAPARHGARDEYWQLSESAFSALMHALFADLNAKTKSNQPMINQRWGSAAQQALAQFFSHLDRQ